MKKGFTLVELLAVILILGITSMVVFPAINKIIANSRRSLYASQVKDIEQAAGKWATENEDLFDKTHANDIYIGLESLRFSSYLEPDAIYNPVDKTEMDGCVRISYDTKKQKYLYDYKEKNCETYALEQSDEDGYGYIVYTYNKTKKAFEASGNKLSSIGEALFNHYKDTIKVEGQTVDGLYDAGDEYVFKGSNPQNYVVLVGKENRTTWRVLSINKKDYSVKLIGLTLIGSNQWNSEGTTDFADSTINNLLLTKVDENGVAYSTNKIDNYGYQIGEVSNSEASIDALKSELSLKSENSVDENTVIKTTTNTSSQKVGSLSVLDYVSASATSTCPENYLSNDCSTNNYIYGILGNSSTTWTINKNSNQIWYINTSGQLALASPTDNLKQIFPVVKLSSNVFVNNEETATGTQENPYTIK